MATRKNISFLATANLASRESFENTLMISSDPTEDIFEATGILKEVTLQDGKVIVEEIVNNMFDSKVGLAELSRSDCSSVSTCYKESMEMDKRLKLWQDTLKDRADMQRKIGKKTGKRPGEMLLNLPSTVEHRDKGTVQRLMDFAERMNPVTLVEKKTAVMPMHFDPCTCKCINEVQETLPQPEQDGGTVVEISGLTNATKAEIMGPIDFFEEQQANENTKWLNSKVLEDRIEEKKDDIVRVIEFFPDIDNLEVVGTNMLDIVNRPRNKEFELIPVESMYTISSTTLEMMEEEAEEETIEEIGDHIAVGIKVNNEIFVMNEKRSSQVVDFDYYFECEPYIRELKQVMRIENIGRQVVSFMWIKPEFYKRQPKFLAPIDDTFLIDRTNFVLFPGEVQICTVVFQPRQVCVLKQRWELKVFPMLFCNKRDTLVLKLHGKCIPPVEFVTKTDFLMQNVIDKSNKVTMDNLTKLHAGLVPLLQPHEVLCPYERIFDEREIFNAQNMGYHCERFDDLENLKTIYKSLKKPREPMWDFELSSIKKLIMRLPTPEQREDQFQLLMEALEPMMCSSEGLPHTQFEHNAERDRSRFIYVRGIIANGIEEWEEMMISLEQTNMKLELSRFYAQLELQEAEEEEESSEDDEPKRWLRKLKYENPEQYVQKKLRGKKYYRDSLYIHSYTLLCDMAENIASVIESTQYV